MNTVNLSGVIENAGPNDLRSFLNARLKYATSVDIAVAFVTLSGLSESLPKLKKVAMNGHVRVLTGLYQCFTEPGALRKLLDEQNDTAGRLSVRLSVNPHFHWKSYFVCRDQKAIAVIGSSNLTAAGLRESGELNVVLSLQRNSGAFQQLCTPFEEEWKQARPLNREQIERYEKARPESVLVQRPRGSLAQILGRWTPQTEKSPQGTQYWRDFITGTVDEATAEVIADTTNWDERGYAWYSSREPRQRIGDRIILFDFNSGFMQAVRVVSTTRTPTTTPDGRYFTAYKQLANTRRRKLGRKLYSTLRLAELADGRAEVERSRKLTKSTWGRFAEILE